MGISVFWRRTALAALLVASVACTGGGNDNDKDGEDAGGAQARAGVYVGRVSATTDRMAAEVGRADGEAQRVRVFLTDGEPQGDAEWFQGTARQGRMRLRSASRRATLEGETREGLLVGRVTLADGKSRGFYLAPARDGAGLYDVTIAPDGRYQGTSTDGWRLEARPNGQLVEGSLSKATQTVPFRVTDLSQVFAYEAPGGRPDRYRVVVDRYGSAQAGRAGGADLERGRPGPNLLSLDLAPQPTTPLRVLHGRLDQSPDELVLVSGQAGPRGLPVTVLLADGEPDGDVEFFTGTVASGSLNVPSASGRAQLTATFGPDTAGGSVSLPGGRVSRFHAVAAGEGAGIYEVTVTPDGRYQGKADDGATLELEQDDELVAGSLQAAAGKRLDLAAYDLSHVLGYPAPGTRPGRYLVLASGRGQSLLGRSGDVRSGKPEADVLALESR